MSMMQRKLYPTDINVSCSYGCDGYPIDSDSYPIPSPPLQPKTASSGHGGQPMSTLMIVLITAFASSFLLVSYYIIIVKYCKRWNPFGTRRRRLPTNMNEEFLDENRGPEIDHHIWYINTVGLQPSIINAITVFRYKTGDSLIEGTECAICLNEFRDDETLRLLPKCDHAFHIPCIDTWLRSHTNCPVCRAGIVTYAGANPFASSGVNSIIMPAVESSSDEENSETGESNDSDEETHDLSCENKSDTNDDRDNHEAKANTESKGDDENMIGDEKGEIQSVRRSVSVDSFMAADISRAVNGLSMAECEGVLADSSQEVESEHGSGEDSREQRTNGGSSITEFLRKKPVQMKRSFSYGGRSFLLRQQNQRSNSILPL